MRLRNVWSWPLQILRITRATSPLIKASGENIGCWHLPVSSCKCTPMSVNTWYSMQWHAPARRESTKVRVWSVKHHIWWGTERLVHQPLTPTLIRLHPQTVSAGPIFSETVIGKGCHPGSKPLSSGHACFSCAIWLYVNHNAATFSLSLMVQPGNCWGQSFSY